MSGVASPENPFAGQGSVLLDIGGDIGALVVSMPASMLGLEVEIRPEHGPDLDHQHVHEHGSGHRHHHPHVAVVARPVAGGQVPSLVFPELSEGRYELAQKGTDDVQLEVAVTGGAVAHASWPH